MTTQPRISASRVSMMLGESKYGTPLSLFHELRGEGPPREDSELLEEGRLFEPVILRQGAKRYRMQLVEGPKELAHGDLVGHPDGYVIDEHGKLAVAEAKNLLFADSGEEAGWGNADTDRVPMAYLLQCQTYGHLLLRQPLGNLFNLSPGPTFTGISDTVYLFARLWHGVRRYKIKVDPAIIAKIEAEASAFLDRVARGEPPDPTTVSEFRTRWSPVPEKVAELDERDFAMLKARQQLKQQIKLAEAEVEKIDIHLLARMQDASIGKFRGTKVLSAGADRAFDEHAFEVAYPEVYGRFLRKLDKESLRKDEPSLYEAFLRLPPAEEQTRKLRPAKAIEEL